jgi:hypothetical protein
MSSLPDALTPDVPIAGTFFYGDVQVGMIAVQSGMPLGNGDGIAVSIRRHIAAGLTRATPQASRRRGPISE